MDTTQLTHMIDVIRQYNRFESTALALFGSSILEDDSTCFSKFFEAQEDLLNFFLNALCGFETVARLEDEDSGIIERICSRFYDDDVRADLITSEDLLNEFYDILAEADE